MKPRTQRQVLEAILKELTAPTEDLAERVRTLAMLGLANFHDGEMRAMLGRYQAVLRGLHALSPNEANFRELARIRAMLERLPAPEPAGLRNSSGSVD